MTVQPGLCGTWSETPKTGFSERGSNIAAYPTHDEEEETNSDVPVMLRGLTIIIWKAQGVPQ